MFTVTLRSKYYDCPTLEVRKPRFGEAKEPPPVCTQSPHHWAPHTSPSPALCARSLGLSATLTLLDLGQDAPPLSEASLLPLQHESITTPALHLAASALMNEGTHSTQ